MDGSVLHEVQDAQGSQGCRGILQCEEFACNDWGVPCMRDKTVPDGKDPGARRPHAATTA